LVESAYQGVGPIPPFPRPYWYIRGEYKVCTYYIRYTAAARLAMRHASVGGKAPMQNFIYFFRPSAQPQLLSPGPTGEKAILKKNECSTGALLDSVATAVVAGPDDPLSPASCM
jgi:hypothetical protein